MKNFRLDRFTYEIICDDELKDAKVTFEQEGQDLTVYLTEEEDRPQYINLRWDFRTEEELYVLGDAWERSYGELSFRKLSENDRPMPWYFAATERTEEGSAGPAQPTQPGQPPQPSQPMRPGQTWCFGVKTQPNAFVCFRYTQDGITALVDCRNGGAGVRLEGRKIRLCTFVFREEVGKEAKPLFESLQAFCRELCDNPLLPTTPIYGGNNWYYAYGKSSYEEILRDTRLQAEVAEGIENPPFMVIDDGWQLNACAGPYEANEQFRDMKALARDIKALGVRPGIWVRLLRDFSEKITEEMRIPRGEERTYLDPTHPAVQAYIREEIRKIRGWGYELLKHDFTTYDLFGQWGKNLTDRITAPGSWHFADDTKTNAEIVLDLYRLILEESGDMLIIGCNTIPHLCAGLVHINRTGDDTSGREWARTRKMGVNTLAFRLAQNKAFYLVDADCVGILADNIPWEKNRQWLDVLSRSDTALFTSCAALGETQKEDMKKAYLEIQKGHDLRPVDIYENLTPSQWQDGEETITYDWE